MKIIDSIIGSYSDRQIRKIIPTVNKIESLADKYRAMSDEELRATTPALRERLAVYQHCRASSIRGCPAQ